MSKRPYEVRIERLVLPPGTVGTRQVRAAVERELARTLRKSGPGADARLDALEVRLERGADAHGLATGVAKAARAKLGGP
jgi:hypothetical protein